MRATDKCQLLFAEKKIQVYIGTEVFGLWKNSDGNEVDDRDTLRKLVAL